MPNDLLPIDTTPAGFPRPPDSLIEAAARALPPTLANVRPGPDKTIEVIGSRLIEALVKQGHARPAACWAVHRLADEGKLLTRPVRNKLLAVPGWMNVGSPAKPALIGKPTPFYGVFWVVATESLWIWWRAICNEEKKPTALDKATGDNPEQLTSEARAILFIQERLKATGRVPTKTAIAKALDVDRRTLNNWPAFKVAYNALRSKNRRQPARGSKSKDGTVEAWRESGK